MADEDEAPPKEEADDKGDDKPETLEGEQEVVHENEEKELKMIEEISLELNKKLLPEIKLCRKHVKQFSDLFYAEKNQYTWYNIFDRFIGKKIKLKQRNRWHKVYKFRLWKAARMIEKKYPTEYGILNDGGWDMFMNLLYVYFYAQKVREYLIEEIEITEIEENIKDTEEEEADTEEDVEEEIKDEQAEADEVEEDIKDSGGEDAEFEEGK